MSGHMWSGPMGLAATSPAKTATNPKKIVDFTSMVCSGNLVCLSGFQVVLYVYASCI